MRAARTDGNQKQVVRDLLKTGFHVWLTHRVGEGGPDMVVTGYNNNSQRVDALLVELKKGKGTLTDSEVEFHAEYPDDGPLIVARSTEDILMWFGRIE